MSAFVPQARYVRPRPPAPPRPAYDPTPFALLLGAVARSGFLLAAEIEFIDRPALPALDGTEADRTSVASPSFTVAFPHHGAGYVARLAAEMGQTVARQCYAQAARAPGSRFGPVRVEILPSAVGSLTFRAVCDASAPTH
jgi:hypothetical protein